MITKVKMKRKKGNLRNIFRQNPLLFFVGIQRGKIEKTCHFQKYFN